jgi:hypothetical protein
VNVGKYLPRSSGFAIQLKVTLTRLNLHCSILRPGYSSKDVAKAMTKLQREKHSQAVSILQTGMDDFNEVKEKVAQGFKNCYVPKQPTNYC